MSLTGKVSVLVPTRKRVDFLGRMLESYFKCNTNPEASEFVFRCDNDDEESIRFLARYPWPIIVGPRRDGYKSLPSFYNEMVRLAQGDLFVCGNDDMLFKTENWAELVIRESRKYPDGIFNIGVSTGLNDDKYPFSIVSRQMVEKMGKINDERLLFSDIFLLDVARHFNRAIRIDSVSFFHDWGGNYPGDQTRQDANRHEFDMVFANDKGDWSESYALLHKGVVAEAIARIDPEDTVHVGEMLSKCLASGGYATFQKFSHGEIFELVRLMRRMGISRERVVLGTMPGFPDLTLWKLLFAKVACFMPSTEGMERHVEEGWLEAIEGRTDQTKVIYKALERFRCCNVLVLDDLRYAALITPYFLFRKHLTQPGLVLFLNTRKGNGADVSMVRRFLQDLECGSLDGVRHPLGYFSCREGTGICYEIIDSTPHAMANPS